MDNEKDIDMGEIMVALVLGGSTTLANSAGLT